MFFCEKCEKKKKWPNSSFKSYGICEICGEVASCNDVPSRFLPLPAAPKVTDTWEILTNRDGNVLSIVENVARGEVVEVPRGYTAFNTRTREAYVGVDNPEDLR